ncbi:MAG: CerR family C-terminal domain-containing protein [Desulfobacterales bacterium]|nr:CerR family C-terminal domain-containing protein [Desulfobacterales bacterium]
MTQLTIDNTRERILDQAERLFALKGFEAVSVREITGAAESNLAAINYHFGNKMNLYLEVFRERWLERTRRVRENFFKQIANKPNPGIDEVVDAMARAFLDGPLNDEERQQHVQLMQRELSHPSDALKMVVEEVMKPYQQQLSDLIRPHLPADIDEERLRLSIVGIIGMTLYFTFARPAVSMIMGRDYNQEFKSMLIEHIRNFALNGLNSLMEEK